MPTMWSQTLIPTGRQVPAEAEVPSHQLMLRAGLIRRLGAGIYDYLPLGCRSLQKAMQIIREEMAQAGAVEVMLPALQPIELWERTGRRAAYGENLFVVKDRHGREQALGPTHEEVITELVGGYIESYKQLPLTLYQIQTKFRDEFRPRFGVLRSREFQMKDAYSFHVDEEGPGSVHEAYEKQRAAYHRIFKRCGIPAIEVEAESGPIGGSASHEFMVPSPTGEDTILESDRGNYAANVEKCEIGKREVSASFELVLKAQGELSPKLIAAAEPKGALEKIHTPGCPGIEDVVNFFKKNLGSKLATKNMLKTLVRVATTYDGPESEVKKWVLENQHKSAGVPHGEDRIPSAQPQQSATQPNLWWFVYCVLRADHEMNEAKLQSHSNSAAGRPIRFIDDRILLESLGIPIGFVGPHAATANRLIQVVVDSDAARDGFWVTGANEVDYHVKGFHWKRDVIDPLGSDVWRIKIADIRNAVAGDPSPKNDGGVLRETKGIEIGHVFKLGTKYTAALDVTALDAGNQRKPVIMGCYGIGVNRILASAIERDGGHDENGIIWPASIAPYRVVITPIKYEGRAKEVADTLAAQLEAARTESAASDTVLHAGGIDVLIDDREERAGVKFKDADLIGIPVRITIGDKALANNQVEIKSRREANAELVDIDAAVQRVTEMLKTL